MRNLEALWRRLPDRASNIVKLADYPSCERNKNFLANPDDPAEHETRWHQWGIITHSRMFEEYYIKEARALLTRWGVAKRVVEKMTDNEVDGISREELFRIAIPLHDIGKFAVRRLTLGPGGSATVSFKGHEKASAVIIRDRLATYLREELELTSEQIEYIARCAEYHYELAYVRDAAKKKGGFNLDFVRGLEFRELCRKLMGYAPEMALEIGLLWLADSLAKIEVHIDAYTDQELEGKTAQIEGILKEKGIRAGLINAAKQVPINVAAAETYLKAWAATL